MVKKRILVPARLRRVPADGFSWVDRRFIREYANSLGTEAILLYFFLTAVSDKHGLSYWGDATTAARLKLDTATIGRARAELVERGLVAYVPPLTQVLSLPVPGARGPGAGPASLREIFQAIACGPRVDAGKEEPR